MSPYVWQPLKLVLVSANAAGVAGIVAVTGLAIAGALFGDTPGQGPVPALAAIPMGLLFAPVSYPIGILLAGLPMLAAVTAMLAVCRVVPRRWRLWLWLAAGALCGALFMIVFSHAPGHADYVEFGAAGVLPGLAAAGMIRPFYHALAVERAGEGG